MHPLRITVGITSLLAAWTLAAGGRAEKIDDPAQAPAKPALPAGERVRDPEDADPEGTVPRRAPPRAPAAAAAAGFKGSLSGLFSTQLSFDTRLNDGREHAAEWRNSLYLKVAVEPASWLRAVVGGRFRHFTAVERNESDAPFLLFNGERPRHFFEGDLWEAHLDLYLPGGIDLRIGNQIFHWGSADFLSPTDVLNPPDLRFGIYGEPDEYKLPVFAASATWRGRSVNVTGAWIPVVTPGRAFLFGHDFGLLQPRAYFAFPDLRPVLPDPLSDGLQRLMFDGSVPSRSFANSQGGVRIWGHGRGIDWGLTYAASYEPFPAVTFDRDLGAAMAAALGPAPDLPRAAALAAQAVQRAAGGEPAALASYQRRQVMGFDLTVPIGPLLGRLDAAYSPEQTVYLLAGEGPLLAPVRRPAVTYTAGLEYRHEEDFFILVQWIHLITVTRPGDTLFLLKPNVLAIFFDVRYRILEGDLEFAVSGLGGVSQGDWMLTATVAYKLTGKLTLLAGASFFEGSKEGPGGYFDGNDFVFVRLRVGF